MMIVSVGVVNIRNLVVMHPTGPLQPLLWIFLAHEGKNTCSAYQQVPVAHLMRPLL